jgi:hypothetical protein
MPKANISRVGEESLAGIKGFLCPISSTVAVSAIHFIDLSELLLWVYTLLTLDLGLLKSSLHLPLCPVDSIGGTTFQPFNDNSRTASASITYASASDCALLLLEHTK